MNLTIFVTALLMVFYAYTEAQTPQCQPVCYQRGQSMETLCVRDSSSHCYRMRQCSIEEENCRRHLSNRQPLMKTSPFQCRYISGRLGSARCASVKPIPKPRYTRPNCQRIYCPNPSKKLKCYRTKQNRCQLLTECQLRRINCQRSRHNPLTMVDVRHCSGILAGRRFKLCRPMPYKINFNTIFIMMNYYYPF